MSLLFNVWVGTTTLQHISALLIHKLRPRYISGVKEVFVLTHFTSSELNILHDGAITHNSKSNCFNSKGYNFNTLNILVLIYNKMITA